MRILKMILFSAATIAAPARGLADPGQISIAPPTATQSTPSTRETVTITATAPRPTTAASDPDEVVCQMSPPRTGSRIGGARECHTRRDWERYRRESRSMVSGMEMRGLEGAGSSMDTRQMGH